MGAARRLYLYLVAAVSLLLVSVGIYNLVDLVIGTLGDAIGASVIGGGSTAREQVSLAIALVAVGLPIYLLHWNLIGRGWRGTDAAGREDRLAPMRAVYLALVATIALLGATGGALQLVDRAARELFGVGRYGSGDAAISGFLAMLAVGLPVWWYHQHRRDLDLRHDRLTGPAAWWTRLHRYAWLFGGLMLLLAGAGGVIETLASVAIGRAGFGADDPWWLATLAWALSTIVAGSAIVAVQARDARRTVADAAVIGEDDRDTNLRATYFGAVLLVALVEGSVAVASSIAGLGRWMLAVGDVSGVPAFLEAVVGPLLVTIPFVSAAGLHWSIQLHEAAERSPARATSAERLALHLIAGVGLALAAVGGAQLLGRLMETVSGTMTMDELFRTELAWYLGQLVVGAALWVPAWAAILRRREASPDPECRAPVGRAYLYLVVAVSMLAALPSAAFTLYRLIDTLLGGRGLALVSELSVPFAIVVVAGLVATYHVRLLLGDLRLAAGSGRDTSVAPATAPATSPVIVAAGGGAGAGLMLDGVGATLTVTFHGPPGADLASVTDAIRRGLPAGVTLEVVRPSAVAAPVPTATAIGVPEAPGQSEASPVDVPPVEVGARS